MARREQAPPRFPGNDGSWYVEMLGIGTDGEAPEDGEVDLDDATQRTAVFDPLEGWAPDEIDRALRSRRPFRWTVVAVAFIVGGLLATGIWWIPRVAERRIAERTVEAGETLLALRTVLPDAQSALATATEPEATLEDLSATAAVLPRVVEAGSALREEASRPLPDPPPIVGSADREALAALEPRFGFMGAEAEAIANRISTVVDYRLGVDGALETPDLPTAADTATVNDLSGTLATVLASATSALQDLPADAALTAHRTTLTNAVRRYGEWQAEYLDALRVGDPAAAQALTREIEVVRRDLEIELVNALAGLRIAIDTAILELAAQLDTTLARLPS